MKKPSAPAIRSTIRVSLDGSSKVVTSPAKATPVAPAKKKAPVVIPQIPALPGVTPLGVKATETSPVVHVATFADGAVLTRKDGTEEVVRVVADLTIPAETIAAPAAEPTAPAVPAALARLDEELASLTKMVATAHEDYEAKLDAMEAACEVWTRLEIRLEMVTARRNIMAETPVTKS